MNRLYLVIVIAFLFCLGCGSEKNPSAPEIKETGKIVVNVTWPEGVAGKKKEVIRNAPDKITAYIYLSGKEVTHVNLKHEGTRGTIEIELPPKIGYRLEIVAYDDHLDMVLYIGFTENITVIADTVTTVDITMYDAAPVLYPAKITGDSSYTLSWSKVPLAVSYKVEESSSSEFASYDYGDYTRLSSTVYSGPDTTKVFTGKSPGVYYYCVFAITFYGYYYGTLPQGKSDAGFYMWINFGAMSNIISVKLGTIPVPSGTKTGLKIDIPWPTK